MNWWNSEPQETGPRLAINQKFADFCRDLWISPETCLEIAPPLTTHVNPPGNLHAGGEGDIYRIIISHIYRIIISEYSVSGLSSHLSSALILQMTMLSQLVGGIVTPAQRTTITR